MKICHWDFDGWGTKLLKLKLITFLIVVKCTKRKIPSEFSQKNINHDQILREFSEVEAVNLTNNISEWLCFLSSQTFPSNYFYNYSFCCIQSTIKIVVLFVCCLPNFFKMLSISILVI